MMDDPKTLGRTRLSFASEAAIDEFVATPGTFRARELTPDQWRAFRLVRGTYGQRQTGDVQMRRVKIPHGVLSGGQLEALANVAAAFCSFHGTTLDAARMHPGQSGLTSFLATHILKRRL